MIIKEKRLRKLIRSELLKEQQADIIRNCPLPFLAAILASEAPNSQIEMSAIYDVIRKRAEIGFQELNTVEDQLREPGQFSGYNRFNNEDDFIAYYSGTAPDLVYEQDPDHTQRGTTVATIRAIRRAQFQRACGVTVSDFVDPENPDAPTYGATHFVNPNSASTGNRWWELPTWRSIPVNEGYIGNHLFGWETSTRQSREAYRDFRNNHPEFDSIYPDSD
jgi:hypothetical protein